MKTGLEFTYVVALANVSKSGSNMQKTSVGEPNNVRFWGVAALVLILTGFAWTYNWLSLCFKMARRDSEIRQLLYSLPATM